MKKVLIVLFSILLLAGFVTCSGDVDNNLFEKTVTYVAGSGEGKPIVRNTVGGCHEILPNSLLEIPKEEPPQQRKLLADTSEADYAGYYKKNFSFYGWADQDGKYYVYNPDSTKNSVKFTKNVTLEALWRNDISGEVITNSEYAKITAYSGSGADTLIIPKVITIWDDKGNHTDYLVSTIDTGAIADDTLKTVILPDSITEIKEFAFTNCKNLATVEMKSETPPIVDTNALLNRTKIQVSDDLEYPETLGGFTVEEKTEQTPVEVSTSVTCVTLSPSEVSLLKGTERQLSYSITPGNATNQKVTFSSSNKSVATVDNEGLVKAVAAGTATITVKTDDGKKEATCSVTVVETTVSVTGITLDNTKTITSGESLPLTANVSPTDATDKRISWSSSDSTIARVDSNGKVTGLQAGTAVITATSVSENTITASCNITVNNTAKGIYSISYELQSGTAPTSANPTSYTTGTGVASFNDPTRTGHTFNGWYDAATGGNKITSISTTDTGAKILYAQWIAKTYTVTLNSDSPTTAFTALTTYTYGVGATLPTDGTKTGYTFSGWYSNSGFSGDAVTTITTTDIENKEFWAKWTPETYTVTLNTNSPTTAFTALTTYTYGVGATLPTDGAKTGYTFSGWYTDSKFSGNAVTVISTTDTENKEFWVKWTANTYKLKFDGNGNTNTSVSMSDQELTYGAASTAITANAFEKTGYTFAGWSTVKDGAVVYADKASVQNLSSTNNDTITLYAKWTANTYKLKFDGNGNTNTSVSMSDQELTYNAASTAITANAFEKTGHTFAGWSTVKDGAVVYADKASVQNLSSTNNDSITLYAKWTPNEYSITYKDQGNTTFTGTHGSNYPTTHTYDTATTLVDPTKTGYTFGGWYTNSGCTDATKVTSLTATGYTADITLYAKWTVNTYKIAFDKNGGSGNTMSEIDCTYGTPRNLTQNTYTRTNYTFLGWTTSTDGSGNVYTDQQSVQNLTSEANATVTLYAKWTPNEYSITYKDQGNTTFTGTHGSNYPTTHTYDTATTLVDPTKTGYTFGGWYTNSGCTDATKVTSLTATGYTADITLYAKWTVNTYKIAFDKNGGSGNTMNEIDCTYGTPRNLTQNTYTRTDYTFLGWTTSTDGSGTVYTDQQSVQNLTSEANATVTLYAKWGAHHSISINYNYANEPHPTNPTYYVEGIGADLSTFNKPTRDGYYFKGWYISNETEITNIPTTANTDITFFAFWLLTHAININYNYADTPYPDNPTYYAEQIGADLSTFNKPTRAGYTFRGWYINNETEITNIPTTANTDITFYAFWDPNNYTVKFNGNGNTNTATMSDIACSYDTAVNLTSNAFEKTGYTFLGWTTSTDGSGTVYTDQQSVQNLTSEDNATVTLYAKWTASTYTITYKDKDDVTFSGTHGDNHPTTHTYDTATTLVEPTKTGYTFGGWYTNSGCTDSTKVTSLTATGYTGNITLYAKWTAHTYTVKFNGNGNTNTATMSDIACSYDTAVNLTSNAFEKTGYVFLGWTTSTDGSGTVYTDQQSVQNLTSEDNATVTLYAKWALPTKGTASTSDTNRPSYSGINNACDWVQLWKDGPKWATMNVGATAKNYSSAVNVDTATVGGLYTWGKTNDVRVSYIESNSSSTSDIAGTADDTAMALWGSNWRMPTKDELNGLASELPVFNSQNLAIAGTKYQTTNTVWQWCDGIAPSEGNPNHMQYVDGCTISGWKISGMGDYSDNSIFIPASGNYYVQLNNNNLNYWSSTPSTSNSNFSYYLSTHPTTKYTSALGSIWKIYGMSVRAVLK